MTSLILVLMINTRIHLEIWLPDLVQCCLACGQIDTSRYMAFVLGTVLHGIYNTSYFHVGAFEYTCLKFEAGVLCVFNYYYYFIFYYQYYYFFSIYLFLGYIYLHVPLYIVCVSYHLNARPTMEISISRLCDYFLALLFITSFLYEIMYCK